MWFIRLEVNWLCSTDWICKLISCAHSLYWASINHASDHHLLISCQSMVRHCPGFKDYIGGILMPMKGQHPLGTYYLHTRNELGFVILIFVHISECNGWYICHTVTLPFTQTTPNNKLIVNYFKFDGNFYIFLPLTEQMNKTEILWKIYRNSVFSG